MCARGKSPVLLYTHPHPHTRTPACVVLPHFDMPLTWTEAMLRRMRNRTWKNRVSARASRTESAGTRLFREAHGERGWAPVGAAANSETIQLYSIISNLEQCMVLPNKPPRTSPCGARLHQLVTHRRQSQHVFHETNVVVHRPILSHHTTFYTPHTHQPTLHTHTHTHTHTLHPRPPHPPCRSNLPHGQ